MTRTICWHCEKKYAFGSDDLCVVCNQRQNHYNTIAHTIEHCDSLDDGILSNISEYMIENNYRLTDSEIRDMCDLREISSKEELDETDKLFQQLHHNNQMIA